jgi:predicted SprT family Zn-dependent metalloprotease
MSKPKTGGSKMSKQKDTFFCKCGGEIKQMTRMTNGKIRNFVRCSKCNEEHRKVNEFSEMTVGSKK